MKKGKGIIFGKRSVIKSGTGLAMTFPAEWAKRVNLEAGDEVGVIANGTLQVIPPRKGENPIGKLLQQALIDVADPRKFVVLDHDDEGQSVEIAIEMDPHTSRMLDEAIRKGLFPGHSKEEIVQYLLLVSISEMEAGNPLSSIGKRIRAERRKLDKEFKLHA